jgi:hypothetical protein
MPLRPALRLCATLAATLAATSAFALTPVRQIGVYVLPYYEAGNTYVEPPKVRVDPAWDVQLAALDAPAIGKVRDAIAAAPDAIAPETMLVLAIRLYDVGLRDDAVFWFYAARDRYVTMNAVLDMRTMVLALRAEGIESLIAAISPVLGGYAFCDLARQQAVQDRAIEWVAQHPYRLLGALEVPALAEDRNAALAQSIVGMRRSAAATRAALARPDKLAELAAARQAGHDDALYCWK